MTPKCPKKKVHTSLSLGVLRCVPSEKCLVCGYCGCAKHGNPPIVSANLTGGRGRRRGYRMEAIAKHDFSATADDELSFRKSQILKVIQT